MLRAVYFLFEYRITNVKDLKACVGQLKIGARVARELTCGHASGIANETNLSKKN